MLKLRSENFGGLVFNTKNGAKLFVDEKGFITIQDFIKRTKRSFTASEQIFLQNICRQLNLNKKEFYLIHLKPPHKIKNYSFKVLNSPILVDFQITNHCNSNCPHCYAESSSSADHVSFTDIIKVLDNCEEAGVFEVALGGGEPTLHPRLVDILKAAQKRNLVCNLATNGRQLDNRLVQIFAKYCGAVALSIEFLGKDFKKRRGFDFERFLASAELIKKTNLRLVFQITVSQGNLFKITEITEFLSKYEPYGIVFLTYKPVGRGENFDLPLYDMVNNEVLKEFKKCFDILGKKQIKIGYDCCMGNLLTGLNFENKAEIYGCSATRESIAVNTNLDVLPCSFVTGHKLGNLNENDLVSVWHSYQCCLFRDQFEQKIAIDKKCRTCQHKLTCLGGCPVFDLVRCKYF